MLAIISYDTEEDDRDRQRFMGWRASVWTTDVPKGIKIRSRSARGINWYAFDPGSPFGGYKNPESAKRMGPRVSNTSPKAKRPLLPMGYTVA